MIRDEDPKTLRAHYGPRNSETLESLADDLICRLGGAVEPQFPGSYLVPDFDGPSSDSIRRILSLETYLWRRDGITITNPRWICKNKGVAYYRMQTRRLFNRLLGCSTASYLRNGRGWGLPQPVVEETPPEEIISPEVVELPPPPPRKTLDELLSEFYDRPVNALFPGRLAAPKRRWLSPELTKKNVLLRRARESFGRIAPPPPLSEEEVVLTKRWDEYKIMDCAIVKVLRDTAPKERVALFEGLRLRLEGFLANERSPPALLKVELPALTAGMPPSSMPGGWDDFG